MSRPPRCPLAVSVSTLIVGALLVLLTPAALYAAERAVRERLGPPVGWGVAIAIGVPLLAVRAIVTLVGILSRRSGWNARSSPAHARLGPARRKS